MERYPYQAPYVILIRIMWRVFGDDMLFLSLELVNAVCAAAAGFLLVKLTDKLFSSRAALGTAMVTVLFLPIYFYSTFAYGNVPSLPFAVGAMLSLHCGFESKKWRYFLLSSVCITVSIMLKSTMQVVLIAMVLIALLHAVKTKNLKFAAVVPILGVVYVLITSAFNIAVSARYDVVLDNGLPKIAWIAMGLNDSAEYPDVSNNPGYYNGFVWNWQSEDYDTEVALSDSWDSIRSSLSRFLSDPVYTVQFFGKKIAVVWLEPTYTALTNGNWSAVVWLEPTYTSLDNGNWLVSTDVGQLPLSDRPMTDILRSVYYGSLNSVILTICDAVQSILLLSPVVLLLRKRGELSPSQLLPVLAALGFFLIYLVWEAKSQYSLPAYVLLLAYAGPALDIVVCYLGRVASRLRERFNNRRRSAQCNIYDEYRAAESSSGGNLH